METVELRITIDKEAVEAIFTLLKALAERESTKEKDISNTLLNTNNTNTFTSKTTTTEKDINNNINTVIVSSLDSDSESYKQGNSVDYNHGNNMSIEHGSDEPTLDSITAYIAKCGYKFSPNKFYEYYNGNGWKTKSGISMKERWREFADMWSKMEKKPLTTKEATTREERQALHPFEKSFDV